MRDIRQDHGLVDWAKSLFRSLSVSLFLWLFGVIIVAFAAYAWVNVRTSSTQWNENVRHGAERFSDLIKRSTHYGMLLNRKEDVRQIIRTVAQEPGVEGVRIYDKRGKVIFSGSDDEVGQVVDMQAEACVICHDQSEPLRSVPSLGRVRIYGESGHRILGLINPIENNPECSSAACHAHPPDQTILGVLDVKMSLVGADARLATTRRQMVVAGILIALLVGFAAALFIYRGVRRPVRRLMEGTGRVAGGDLDTEIVFDSENEMGRLARSFNKMTHDLRRARNELTAWSERLETKLGERTEELHKTQRQVVHMEKMASLGKLSATVAHELNNPLAGILNYAKLVERTIDEGRLPAHEQAELRRYTELIHKEAGRCGEIVRNLLLFARPTSTEMGMVALTPIVERALMLVNHHMEMAEVRLDKRLELDDDRLVCDGDQIQQALMALMVNAVEAMPNGGKLTVQASAGDDSLELRLEDTGCGISAGVLPQIFEPFFSTKDETSGVGLGLAVTYGIIQRHQGEIEVDSEVGRGTRFTIRLPRRPVREDPATYRDQGEEPHVEPQVQGARGFAERK
jgi:two-component system NtrC family sensor kinase